MMRRFMQDLERTLAFQDIGSEEPGRINRS